MNGKEINNTYRNLMSSLYFVYKDEFIRIFEETKDNIDVLKVVNNTKSNGEYIKLYDILYEIRSKNYTNVFST